MMRMMRLHHRTSAGTAAGTAGMSEAAAANPTTFESELEAMFAAELHNMENLENLAENREATATATATATDDVDFGRQSTMTSTTSTTWGLAIRSGATNGTSSPCQ